MQDSDIHNEQGVRRPLGMTLLGGLYLFFFMLSISSYGQPIPFFGSIYDATFARIVVFVDSLFCLYLFLGLLKRQKLTWYLLLGYNAFEAANTLTNLLLIAPADLEKIIGEKVDPAGLITSNITVTAAIILLSLVIFQHRTSFTNRSNYLF